MFFNQITQTPGEVTSLRMPCGYLDDLTSAFESLCQNKDYCLLLESAEIESKDNLKSIMLLDAAVVFECYGSSVTAIAQSENGQSALNFLQSQLSKLNINSALDGERLTVKFEPINPNVDEEKRLMAKNAFEVLRRIVSDFIIRDNEPMSIFVGGVFAYDMYANFEQVMAVKDGPNTCPDYCFYLAETLLVIDHQSQSAELFGNIFSGDNVYAACFDIGRKLEDIKSAIELLKRNAFNPSSSTNVSKSPAGTDSAFKTKLNVDVSDEQYMSDVELLKQNIINGDIFQVVPSRAFSYPCHNPTLAYRHLKKDNPSPYMFYLKHKEFCLFGASPESALKYDSESRQVEVYPIAGTRTRGFDNAGNIDRDKDSRIELELRNDHKEVSEHTMLVDLARNDIARISETGSRYVSELMNVDRYSHVMHLVSKVVGTLKENLDALHAYQACMNMGTLVGAPKISAANLIRSVEQKRRGSYGGAVGYLNGNGDMDTCIVIRSAFVKDKTALIQAGAGVVFDSVPELEAQETTNKAMAVIKAVAKSEGV
jgi:anthranilate synthase component I